MKKVSYLFNLIKETVGEISENNIIEKLLIVFISPSPTKLKPNKKKCIKNKKKMA